MDLEEMVANAGFKPGWPPEKLLAVRTELAEKRLKDIDKVWAYLVDETARLIK